MISADYRLVPDHRFPAFVEDTAAAIAWAARHAGRFGGDGGRVYLAAHGLTPDVIGGVAALAGPFDFLPLDDPATIAAFGHWPHPGETQPVNAVTPAAPPFLLITGEADRTVYPRNSQRLAARLRDSGVAAELLVLDGLGHADVLTAIARPLRWRAPVLEEVSRFFLASQASANRS